MLPFGWHEVTGRDPPSDMRVSLQGLSPSSCYEAIVQVRNFVGWNDVAGPFKFYTKGQVKEGKRSQAQQSPVGRQSLEFRPPSEK